MHRRTRAARRPNLRNRTMLVETLEVREVLSATPALPGLTLTPMFEMTPYGNPTPPASAFTPSQVRQAYGFNGVTFNGTVGDGTGTTIAIVDAYGNPTIQADLNTFSAQFGLPAGTVTRVGQTGSTTALPAADPSGGWNLEAALDVQWAHAIAPGAKILLVEANSPSDADLMAAVDYAAAHANVISMSWGGGEWSGESSYDGHFSRAGVAFVAASGDDGAPISWPGSSPNVLSVGGTALHVGTGSAWSSEAGWGGSGGGPSAYEARPSYQTGVVTQTANRANPDVAYDADPNTGFAVYGSFNYNGSAPGWMQIGGTSAGSPQWAALLAIVDQGRAVNGLPTLNSASATEVMATLYKNATSGIFHDITSGTSTGTPSYTATAGYDYVTGLGSPLANLVISTLVGVPASSDHLVVSAPTAATAGTSFSVTVSAQNAGNATDAGYLGTVHFASNDTLAGLPANYTFTAADKGVHTFTVTLKTAGTRTITVTDTAGSAASVTSPGVAVSPAAASQFLIAGLPTSATAGAAQTFTVTAKDAYGNVATGYLGTATFTSSDGRAALPAAYTFTAADKGVHGFSATFNTAGTQSLTVSDGAGIAATQAGITVSPAAPISLTATAASPSQINLSWTAAAGATGYSIERSANGTSGWAQVGTTTGATAYSDAGLAASTTYYYRVRATGAGQSSAYSNTANATTSASTAASSSVWDNSVIPNPNNYGYGSYELGMKFRSDAAGSVTGVKFFKQTWMGGVVHVGHLWSSSGALLATATFTGESGSGWQTVSFSNPVAIAANSVYVVSFSTGGGYYMANTGYFAGHGVDNGPLHALADGVSGSNGVYSAPGTFPRSGYYSINFWVDVNFTPGSGSMARVAGGSSNAAGATPAVSVAPAASDATSIAIPTSGIQSAASFATSVQTVSTYRRGLLPAQGLARRGWGPGF